MNKKSKLIGLILTFAVVGCDLEVNNPNSLLEDDLKDPSAASAVANGAWNAALRGISYMMSLTLLQAMNLYGQAQEMHGVKLIKVE